MLQELSIGFRKAKRKIKRVFKALLFLKPVIKTLIIQSIRVKRELIVLYSLVSGDKVNVDAAI